jgi:DMSO reductase anchor subunit
MEVQIPLVLFTSLLAWSAGTFGTQCILALKKKGSEIQKPALLVSFLVLVAGGIAVFFHLQHWERIFNGFGHITSGITQELIAIVLLVVVMLIFFLMFRRSGDESVPNWVSVLGLIVCLALIVAMGHSYMVDSRPAWNTLLQVLSLLGAACMLGPATIAIISGVKKVQIDSLGKLNVIGTCINAVLTVVYMIAMQVSSASLESFSYYFDPTHPNYSLKSGVDISLFSGDCTAFTVVVIIGLIVTLVAAFVAKKQDKNWAMWGTIIVVAGLACVIALRCAMYIMGATLFMLY